VERAGSEGLSHEGPAPSAPPRPIGRTVHSIAPTLRQRAGAPFPSLDHAVPPGEHLPDHRSLTLLGPSSGEPRWRPSALFIVSWAGTALRPELGTPGSGHTARLTLVIHSPRPGPIKATTARRQRSRGRPHPPPRGPASAGKSGDSSVRSESKSRRDRRVNARRVSVHRHAPKDGS
jgi:hypothetical protein